MSSPSLPSVPRLPPLQMPGSSQLPTSYQLSHSDVSHTSSSPSPDLSKDSFPPVVPTSSQTDIWQPNSSPGLSSLAPPINLRKSISVDSFVKYTREETQPIGTRQNRGNTGSALDPPRKPVFGISDGLKRERELARSRRSRGASFSTMGDNDLYGGDSDVERSDPLYHFGHEHRRASLKGQDYPRPFVRAGELPLPSRTPTLSSTSSQSSMSGVTSLSAQDEAPRLHTAPSVQPMPRRGTTASLGSVLPVRARSGSLGVYVSSSNLRISINTQVSPSHKLPSDRAVTLAVMGIPGCGKSVAIRKGLKAYSLSEPISVSMPMGNHICARYTRRVGRVIKDENSIDVPLNVIEIDVIPDDSDGSIPRTLPWSEELPNIDGVVICYDASDETSFKPVESLLRGYRPLKLPIIALACKSDLQQQVEPAYALDILQKHDVGLVEVTNVQEQGKDRMKLSFEYLLRAIFKKRSSPNEIDPTDRNPASPSILTQSLLWENSRTATPTASPSMSSMRTVTQAQSSTRHSQSPFPPVPSIPSYIPGSPTRARSASDLLYERDRAMNCISPGDREQPLSRTTNGAEVVSGGEPVNGTESNHEESKEVKDKQSRPAQWATLDELLDKLLFLAVSGDDQSYITHFLLTYRRFATPRSVILAMQKRMRQLDNPSGDPMFACFAQMRICHLLELWIRNYPHDFAVPGTAGALAALVKSIIAKTYLLHYGTDFLPFLELLPSLVDKDVAWSLKMDETANESEESSDEEDEIIQPSEGDPPTSNDQSPISARGQTLSSSMVQSRERRLSLPPSARALLTPSMTPIISSQHDTVPMNYRHLLKDLQKTASEINAIDSLEIAQEITRLEAQVFLAIEPRHWLQYTFLSGRRDPLTDQIARFNCISNHIAGWVVSLILCHDRTKARAKQIEKFVDIAAQLRTLNNYSALRAFVAGINSSTFSGDQTMERFKATWPSRAKDFRSWDVLLQQTRGHRAYRLALRNTRGACIPALEVHMSDLIRAHEGNPDFNEAEPSRIHWGKFNMMGRFITGTTQCQLQCENANDYNFPERPHIKELLLRENLMDEELQKSRIAPPDADLETDYRPPPTQSMSRENSSSQSERVALLRRLFFW